MVLSNVFQLLSQYGACILLVITFLESLNCPGLPAGVILPAAGIYASHGGISIIQAIVLTIVGGLIGASVLYVIGRVGGAPALDWMKRRSAQIKRASEKCECFLKKGGFATLTLGRVVPVVRTIIPLPAGALRVSAKKFVAASAVGISCYNIVCVGAGYFLGHALF